MSAKKTASALFTFFFAAGTFAQSIVVDMDTAAGIQATSTSKETGQVLTVQIRIGGAAGIYSYQCKVAFDTSRLTFMAAQLDGGILGEKNILSRNGGVPIGVCQVQQNPPASDTIEISGTITGTDPAKSVSGDGLMGIIYFTSKTAVGDSCTITACNGFTAPLDGALMAVVTYTNGKHYVIPPVSAAPHRVRTPTTTAGQNCRTVTVTIGTSEAMFEIPAPDADRKTSATFRLFSINGKLVAVHTTQLTNTTPHLSMSVPSSVSMLSGGTYIGRLDIGGSIVSQTIHCK